jgi:hypothetical protein
LWAIAYLVVRNEADVLEEVAEHHRSQGLEIVVIDNGSDDASPDVLEALRSRQAILEWASIVTGSYAWEHLIAAGAALALRYHPDWIVHLDASSFLESDQPKVRTLADQIEEAHGGGFNVVSLKVYDFYPTNVDDPQEPKLFKRLRWYTARKGTSPVQEKIFRAVPGLRTSDGHSITFPAGVEKRLYPIPAVMRHYVFRSRGHGVRKLLERKSRWDGAERKLGRHIHYDGYLGSSDEIEVETQSLNCKGESSAWIDAPTYERPAHLLSEHHDFNQSGWFDAAGQKNSHLCLIVGCQRSGTTLLRLVLEMHPEVSVFEEPTAYDYWADPELLEQTVEKGRSEGKRLFVFKAPCLTEQLDRADGMAQELRYYRFPFRFRYDGQLLLFAVRDPRDVCLSLKRLGERSSGDDWIDIWPRYIDALYPKIMPEFEKRYARDLSILRDAGPYGFAARAALYWKVKTESFFRYDALGYKLRLILYEDFVTSPRRNILWLCRFLGLRLDERMVEHHRQPHAEVYADGLTVGDTDPQRAVDSNSTRAYRGRMPIKEQEVILEIAGNLYRSLQSKWLQQLRNDIMTDASS